MPEELIPERPDSTDEAAIWRTVFLAEQRQTNVRLSELVRQQERIAEALEKPGFWERFGELSLKGMSTFCGSVGGHRVAALLALGLVLAPVLWLMAGTGMHLQVGDWISIGPGPLPEGAQ